MTNKKYYELIEASINIDNKTVSEEEIKIVEDFAKKSNDIISKDDKLIKKYKNKYIMFN